MGNETHAQDGDRECLLALQRELVKARREAVFGVGRVASSFANDLAEAREGVRVLLEAVEAHMSRYGDPDGMLAAARDAVRRRPFRESK